MRTPDSLAALCVATLFALPASAAEVADDAPASEATHPRVTPAKSHGNASFYARHFTGHKTASGERYDPNALTAAHRTLPLGTKVKVTNPKNDKSVIVTVNDRGPGPKNRVIDVSSAAADALGMKKAGVTKVETEVVGGPDRPTAGDPEPAVR